MRLSEIYLANLSSVLNLLRHLSILQVVQRDDRTICKIYPATDPGRRHKSLWGLVRKGISCKKKKKLWQIKHAELSVVTPYEYRSS